VFILGVAMRNLVLLLIIFIAVLTFIRAFDKVEAGTLNGLPVRAAVENTLGN
jgi:hypothetical protein